MSYSGIAKERFQQLLDLDEDIVNQERNDPWFKSLISIAMNR